MPVLTITSFSTFAGLLLAARKLATDPDPLNRVKALADLAAGGKALAAALRDTGLTPLAAEMARQAEDHAAHFTHPGPARDDAIAVFWQVAPEAFADSAAFAAADLDPDPATEAMVAAIKASPHAHDFAATVLAEPLFRSVTLRTLAVMLDRADYLATITPDLWRETLRRHGVTIELLQAVKDDTAEILALVRELHAIKRTTVPEITLIAMARKIGPRVADRDEALRALDAAADLAAEARARGEVGSNVDAFVDATLRRLAAMTGEGRLDEAASEADRAVEQAEAGLAQLLDAAVNQHLLAFDAEGAASAIVKRANMEASDPDAFMEALRREYHFRHDHGRDKGLRLELEVAAELARHRQRRAGDASGRVGALNDLGVALAKLGEWDATADRLHEAVTAFRGALGYATPEDSPVDWAMAQMNLGNVLAEIGKRERGTDRLHEAVAAYSAALTVWTRERSPLAWATVQHNLANALAALGDREGSNDRLRDAVTANRAALEERSPERVPSDWASTQSNLGNVLVSLGQREGSSDRLREAVAAFRAALGQQPRDRVPLEWAATQNNLGNALLLLGDGEGSADRLREAVSAFQAALEESTRERTPLEWAARQGNLGAALGGLGHLEGSSDWLRRAVDAFRAALEEQTRERVPMEWAKAQHNLASALQLLGDLVGSADLLREAINSYEAALEERTQERVPLYWARSIGNQGIALRALAAFASDLATARRALDQITKAEAAARDLGNVGDAAYYAQELPAAEALVARLTENY